MSTQWHINFKLSIKKETNYLETKKSDFYINLIIFISMQKKLVQKYLFFKIAIKFMRIKNKDLIEGHLIYSLKL